MEGQVSDEGYQWMTVKSPARDINGRSSVRRGILMDGQVSSEGYQWMMVKSPARDINGRSSVQ